jgi:hypothetical protein
VRRFGARERGGRHDHAIIAFVARHGIVAARQIVRYVVLANRRSATSSGYDIIRRLIARGVLARRHVPSASGRPLLAVTLSEHGYALARGRDSDAIDAETRAPVGAIADPDWCLQYAEVCGTRGLEGWAFVPEAERGPALRTGGLRRLETARAGSRDARRWRQIDALHAPRTIALEVLRRDETGEVRIVLPVRGDRSVVRDLASLPDLRAYAPIAIELVCGDPADVRPARDTIIRWARAGSVAVAIHSAPHFRRSTRQSIEDATGSEVPERFPALPSR